jgi:peptidoglycan/xylan/chitin deacetylase (PgdA/CDA1 family)
MKSEIKSLIRKACNLVDTPALILIYHRVTVLESDPQLLAVSPENFDAQIRHLKEHYTLLNVDEFAELISNNKKFPRKAVLLTFDDGYADNLHEAIPILEKHNAQALFYISTALLDTPYEFWWDDLERIFLTGKDLPDELTMSFRKDVFRFKTKSDSERRGSYDQLHPLVKSCNVEDRAMLLEKIVAWSGHGQHGRPTHRILTTEELRKLASSPASVVGAHTHTHPRLSNCSYEIQLEEISHSKRILEETLGKSISHFSYPFGSIGDFNDDSVRVCGELGFKMVCANYYNQVHRWHHRFRLPRVLVRDWNEQTFSAKMKTFFNS